MESDGPQNEMNNDDRLSTIGNLNFRILNRFVDDNYVLQTSC